MRRPPGRMPAAGRPTATDRPARATRRARHRPLSPATSCCRATAAIVGQVLAAGGGYYAATTAGEVAAFTADGRLRWRVDVGQLASSCEQLDGYGILGT